MDYSALIARVKPSIALVIVTQTDPTTGVDVTFTGSGFVFSQEGKLATCNHVVQNAKSIQIRFAHSTTLVPATFFKADVAHDLAILNFTAPAGTVSPLPLTAPATNTVQEGQPVMFCGFPLNKGLFMTHHGMISGIERDAVGNPVYAVDGSNNKGNSGGPLFNQDGQVIGVMSSLVVNDPDNLLSDVYGLALGGIHVHGKDLIAVQKRLIEHIQLGVGVARPSEHLNVIVI